MAGGMVISVEYRTSVHSLEALILIHYTRIYNVCHYLIYICNSWECRRATERNREIARHDMNKSQ